MLWLVTGNFYMPVGAKGGLCLSELFEELTVEDYEELNRVNYLGVIYTVKAGYASIKRG